MPQPYGTEKGKQDAVANEAGVPPPAKEKKIMGMRKKPFWIVLVILLLLLALGVGLGAGLGIGLSKGDKAYVPLLPQCAECKLTLVT